MTSTPPRRILLVDDEPGLTLTVGDRLTNNGFIVAVETEGPSAVRRATEEPWDVILLDVMLPGADGFEVCREVRRKGVKTPIIMLTARGQTVDKVRGLSMGADDYLTKPFDMAELTARIAVQLRRQAADGSSGATEYRFGDVTIDLRRAEVHRNRVPVALAAREFLLLKYFIEHRGATLTRDELLNEVWGYPVARSTRTVDVHVAWLRQKLEPNPHRPQFILTVHGLGYKFAG
jgi:two-component system alkaline phosphatase synthesis response regulator PhoP